MVKKNRTIYTILGMLTIEPMTGYEIKQTIKTSTAFFWSESEGQIYPALAQCVDLGWATCKEEMTKGTARVKKTYKITSGGQKALTSWLGEKAQPSLLRNELLLKLFFGKNVDISENIGHLKNHSKEIEADLKTFIELRNSLNDNYKNSPHLNYWLITLEHGIKIAKAELSWCLESLKTLEDKKG